MVAQSKRNHNAQNTQLCDKLSGAVRATVEKELVRWTFRSKHGQLLLKPQLSICKDEPILRQALDAGAVYAVVWDADTSTLYRAKLEDFWTHGFAVRRGHGNQRALPLVYWSINGATPEADRTAAATNKARKGLQMGMFEGNN